MSDERAIRALEDERCRAITTADLESLDTLLHPQLRHVHMNGSVQDKAGYLAALPTRPRATCRESLTVRVVGDIAITSGVQRNTWPDRPAGRMHVLQVWMRDGDGWLLAECASSGPMGEAE